MRCPTQTHSVAHIDYAQIKEPEGYVDKSKRRQDGKRRRNHEDKTRSIKDFFKGEGHRLDRPDAAAPSQPGAVLLPCSPLQSLASSMHPRMLTPHKWLFCCAAEGKLSREEMRWRMADAATARLPETATQAEPWNVESCGANSGEAAARQLHRTGVDLVDDELFKSPPRRFRGEGPQQLTDGAAERQVWDGKGEGKLGASADMHMLGGAAGGEVNSPNLKQSNAGMSSVVLASTAGIQAPVSCPNCGQTWNMITNEDLNGHLDACLDSAMIVLD